MMTQTRVLRHAFCHIPDCDFSWERNVINAN